MTVESIIDSLPEAALRELCVRYLYEPSERADTASLRRTVQHAYLVGDISADAITSKQQEST